MKFLLFPLMLAVMPALAQNALVSGLDSPFKLAMTRSGRLLVSEAGRTPNTGRVSLVDRSGRRQTIIAGLPSVTDGEGGLGLGVSGMALRGQTLYLLISEGDVVVSGPRPGTQVPNPAGASSPIFSCLLSLRFANDPEAMTREFTLTKADHYTLADGLPVELNNGAGTRAVLEIVTDFRDVTPDANNIVRASNPFSLDFDRRRENIAYVADSGLNKVYRVDVNTGRSRTVVSFPPIPNISFGPPVVDVVPTAVRTYGDQLLVTFLTGFPFASGAASTVLLDPDTGRFTPFITGRTTLMDVAVRDRSPRAQFFVLEFSSALAAAVPGPGSLLQYDSETARPVATDLVTPVSMVVDPQTGEIFVTEAAAGRITKLAAQ